MSPRQRSLDALRALRWRLGSPPTWCHAGALAGRKYGVAAPIEVLEIIATGPLPTGTERGQVPLEALSTDSRGGQRWTPTDGIDIVWRSRGDHYRALWEALAHSTGEQSPPIISGPALVTLTLQSRTQPDFLVKLLMAGHIDLDEARAMVLAHLGPYALDDLETVIQDVEWLLMRQRYASDDDVH